MKKSTVIATLLLSMMVEAPLYAKTIHSSVSDLKARLRGEKPSVPSSVSPKSVDLQPVRYGRFKAKVFAYNTVKNSDGSYSTTNQYVCTVQGRAPVYDARNVTGQGYNYNYEFFYCDAAVDGKSVRIGVSGIWLLAKFNVFDDEPEAELKFAEMAIEAREGSSTFFFSTASSFTRQVDLRSLIADVGTFPGIVCRPAQDGSGDQICEYAEGMSFNATVEVMD